MVVGSNGTLNSLDAPSMNDTVLQNVAPTSVYLGFMEGSRFWIQRVLVPIVVSALLLLFSLDPRLQTPNSGINQSSD